MISFPEVLILASRFDFTCDYVISKLNKLGTTYLRLNSEDFPEFEVVLDPCTPSLSVRLAEQEFGFRHDTIKSIYYRRPVYFRDFGESVRTPEEDFERVQWLALIRNLTVFESVEWLNNPASTYAAEHKGIQLRAASRLGFDVPQTLFTNSPFEASKALNTNKVALKGIETVLLRHGGNEVFGYTSILNRHDLEGPNWKAAPVSIQDAIEDKIDIRVTVVGDTVFAAEVREGGDGIPGDWRLRGRTAEFKPHQLPRRISDLCRSLTEVLGLRMGTIDLTLQENQKYQFLEINPTGEWAWLVDAMGDPIDECVARVLAHAD